MNFEIRLATIKDLEEKWNYEIKNHPNDNRWKIWKDVAMFNVLNGFRLCFCGLLNGEIIAEATAVISKGDTGLENKDFVTDDTVYLEAFRVNKNYRGKGYFSKLYKFMEDYLLDKGFNKLILGVEPSETVNLEIYKHYGYTQFIAERVEKYPPQNADGEEKEYLVHYYMKTL